jgi:type 1 glutamine amidotransferase
MRVLVMCDDYWHPASVPKAGLEKLGTAGFELHWVDNTSNWSAEDIFAYPLVLLTKSNNVSSEDQTSWVNEDVERTFASYVRKGNGLLVVHSGTVYKDKPEMRRLIGGAFLEHPKQCMVSVEPIAHHPLTIGSNPFTVMDEHYMMAFDDESADVFMTTTSEHGTQPAGWTRSEGKGRVCVLTPGHNVEVWLHPAYQILLTNAMYWCGQKQ